MRLLPQRTVASVALVFLTCLLAAQFVAAETKSFAETSANLDAQLIAAAQQQDIGKARSLLNQGANVDAKSRYGATPLFFAADKGDLEMVKLLLEHHASLDVVDTFYKANPLTFALSKVPSSAPHRQVVLEILKHRPAGAGQALGFAAATGDAEIAKAALAAETISVAELETAFSAAQNAGNDELTRLIAPRLPKKGKSEPVVVPAGRLAAHVGDYKSEELALEVKVFLDDSDTSNPALKLQVVGQPAVSLRPKDEMSFSVVEVAGIQVTFQGRGGLTEAFVLDQNGRHLFARVEASAPSSVTQSDAGTSAVAKTTPLPKAERQPARPWPSFRGAGAAGIADGQGAPTTWNGNDGTNVLWKQEIPGMGLSSPVVWGNQVFLTTAISSAGDQTFRTGLYGDVDSVPDESEHVWKVYALDRRTGEIVWQRTAATGVPKVKRHTKSSHANPTPATDGQHLIAHFGSEGLFAYDMNGDLLWHQDLGKLVSGWFYDASYEWGFSSSPIIYKGKVIVQTDIQEGSFIAAFDVATGEELWRTEREEIPTWGTPTILPGDKGDEVVTNGTTIRGYDAETGRQLWTLGPNSEVTVGTPVVADGIAYITGGYPPVRPIYAVRPGGRGDLSLPKGESESEHVAWSTQSGGTYIPSPTVYQGRLYMTHNNGRLSVHNATTGERLYRARLGKAESFSGSPVAADGKLYFTTEEGKTIVVRSGPTFEVIAENELGEVVMTTPAISDGILFLRGMNHVFALSDTPPPANEGAAKGHR